MSNIVVLTLFSFILNIPFGYFRKRSKKYSLKWFLYIHLPVPLVIIARLVSHADSLYRSGGNRTILRRQIGFHQ
jgi:hypothetical protein